MFSTQDSVDFVPASIHHEQETNSPVRKKGRARPYHRDNASAMDGEKINPFGFSQDSLPPSQFSQNFAERLGHLHMFCSQDNSNMSIPVSAVPVPYMTGAGNSLDSAFQNSRLAAGVVAKSSTYASNAAPTAETERAIDVAPPLANVFLTGVRPHSELYFDPASSSDAAPSKKKAKKPTKVWIGAFIERPRMLTEFEEVKMLGEGTFSTVMCVRHRLDGCLYAIKRVRESIVTERQGNLLLREVGALAALQGCPHVVRYYGAWIDNHHLFIQTELCHLGSLEDLISPQPSKSSIMFTACAALNMLRTGGHWAGGKNVLQERNRSDSFNSIDIHDEGLLQEDECLTAPGPSDHPQHAPATGQKSTARGMLPPPIPSSSGCNAYNTNTTSCSSGGAVGAGNNDSNSGMFMTQQSQSQPTNQAATTSADSTVVPRGVSEDLAWMVLHDVGQALKYMHEREMVHLDLRPANIFLTTAASFRDMDSQDPHMLLVEAATGGNSNNGVASKSAPNTLFASILNAAPLEQHQPQRSSSNGTSVLSRAGTGASTSSTAADPYCAYDVRGEVEARLVRRQYVMRVGDFGHCCRVDEKSAIQEGQTRYCPRELINLEEEYLDATKADVFSLGASVYELCLGRFLGAEGEEGIAEWHSIRDGHLDAGMQRLYSPALCEVLHLMLHPDPAHRPSAAALVGQLLGCKYPHSAERRSAIFPPASLEETVAQLRRENAELRSKVGSP